MPMYRVAQNKPYYLLMFSKFSISTTKNVRVAARMLVKAVLNVSSTDCDNERQSFAKRSYRVIDDVLTNLHDFFHALNDGKQADGTVYWV